MNYESNRLNTFSDWPITSPVDPIRIAKAGFFYTGQGFEVQCFSCGSKISQWNYGDQVMARHRRLDANCPFVVNPQESGNVALVLDQSCPGQINSIPDRPSNHFESGDLVHNYGVTEDDDIYKTDALRLLSFVNWNDSSVSRESLVRAGFYHAGEGRLRCAWCGGELARMRRLGALGDPLDVHLRYFPGCSYAESVRDRDEEARAEAARSAPPATPPLREPSPPASPDTAALQTPGAVANARVLAGGGTWRTLGVVVGSKAARHPNLSSASSRLVSFTDWPTTSSQTPRALADAGFFYTGVDDQVRCFYCDGGLGRWEAGDCPWREHARWFPHCGYLLLLKGKDFVERCKAPLEPVRPPLLVGPVSRIPVVFPVTDEQVSEQMEGAAAMSALSAGLDVARVRRAIWRRLRTTGQPFSSSEALIDAVLDDQLNEEAWSASPHNQRFARDILAETLREFAPAVGLIPSSNWDERSESRQSQSESSTRSLSPTPVHVQASNTVPVEESPASNAEDTRTRERSPSPPKVLSLEEENRQLKEARLCKVCMDGEVSLVFLPCGHLVSCAACGVTLSACPLCRARVQALVRAYLA